MSHVVDRIAYRRGHTGPAVAEIRARLARVGLLTGPAPVDPVDAVFDDDVDTAVRTFQQQRGITVDGIVGPDTFRRLEEARWSVGDRSLMYTPGHLTAGDDVAQLQRRLTGMGFDCGRVDGVFGPNTDRALREFQRGVGIEVDGTAGPGRVQGTRPAGPHGRRGHPGAAARGHRARHGPHRGGRQGRRPRSRARGP